MIHTLALSMFASTLPSAFQQKVSKRNWQRDVCLGAVLSCNLHRRLFYVTLNDCVHYTNSLGKKENTFYSLNFSKRLSTSIWWQKKWERYTDCDQTKFSFWICSCDYVFLCLFPFFSRPYRSLGKSPGACPPEEATISVWMRGYRTVVWKCQRAWLMESPGYAVISPWLSSPQIYRLLITASPTLMETQACSFELSAI